MVRGKSAVGNRKSGARRLVSRYRFWRSAGRAHAGEEESGIELLGGDLVSLRAKNYVGVFAYLGVEVLEQFHVEEGVARFIERLAGESERHMQRHRVLLALEGK